MWLFRNRNDLFDSFYPPAKRNIYHYWDGEKQVSADPMILYKRIMDVGPELSIDIKVSNSPSKDASKSDDEVVRKIRKIFDIKDFSSGGLLEEECKNLLDHFLAFCEILKKKLSPSSTLSESSETRLPEENQPTPSSSASGSTENACSTGSQQQ